MASNGFSVNVTMSDETISRLLDTFDNLVDRTRPRLSKPIRRTEYTPVYKKRPIRPVEPVYAPNHAFDDESFVKMVQDNPALFACDACDKRVRPVKRCPTGCPVLETSAKSMFYNDDGSSVDNRSKCPFGFRTGDYGFTKCPVSGIVGVKAEQDVEFYKLLFQQALILLLKYCGINCNSELVTISVKYWKCLMRYYLANFFPLGNLKEDPSLRMFASMIDYDFDKHNDYANTTGFLSDMDAIRKDFGILLSQMFSYDDIKDNKLFVCTARYLGAYPEHLTPYPNTTTFLIDFFSHLMTYATTSIPKLDPIPPVNDCSSSNDEDGEQSEKEVETTPSSADSPKPTSTTAISQGPNVVYNVPPTDQELLRAMYGITPEETEAMMKELNKNIDMLTPLLGPMLSGLFQMPATTGKTNQPPPSSSDDVLQTTAEEVINNPKVEITDVVEE